MVRLALAALAILAMTAAAHAQGISAGDVLHSLYYPCADCRQIPCAEVKPDRYGTRSYGAVNFGSRTLRPSMDERCYGCWKPRPPGGKAITIGMCLIMPEEMWRP